MSLSSLLKLAFSSLFKTGVHMKMFKKISQQDQLYLYFILLCFLINNYLVQEAIIKTQKEVRGIENYQTGSLFLYVVGMTSVAFFVSSYHINWKFLLKIPIIYLVYSGLSYLI
ncbi:hypothetical protein [Streptococcus massiliensis]|uniref:Uncharacterized protein n=1 Tax=Streptococcus massiliensis TaxID=313439 RepID=A0A380KX09_9STRE|nr:hypothetical protein [Streptococcus massiliensis]SUN75664.1 Uncharacterised protein [Streptococcus massiliensis]